MLKSSSLFRKIAIPSGLVLAGAASFMVGCTRQVYLPVEKSRTDTLYRVNQKVDTIIDRDSVYFSVKGDTVVREVYKLRTRVRLHVDTVNRVKTDTVIVTVMNPEAPSAQSAGKSFLTHLLNSLKWGARIAMLMVIAYLAVKLYRRLKLG